MTSRKHATIREIAAAAGVSTSTVSRAFSRPDMLSPETVAEVQRIAAELAYVPNRSARALSTGLHGTIALVVSDIANPFFAPLIRGIEQRCDVADTLVLLGDADESAGKEITLIAKLAHQADGVIVAGPRSDDAGLRALAAHTPMVLVNRHLDGVAEVVVDTARGMRQAVDHLATHGHSLIAYAPGPADSWANTLRHTAIQEAANAIGIDVVVLDNERPTHEAGLALTSRIVESRATAVIAFDDVLGQGIIAGLGTAGIAVPDQISVIGCDDTVAARTFPAMSAIAADLEQAGSLAADTLFSVIASAGLGPVPDPIEVPTTLVVRDSTGPVVDR